MNHMVKLPDGTLVPALGQGTWHMGETARTRAMESKALCEGLRAGMTLIDTAELYGNGASEKFVGENLHSADCYHPFVVSKVLPQNAGRRGIFKSCEGSLKRLGVDCLDLYLLHWRGSIPLAETVACMEELKDRGKIRRWGVSNFDTTDMEELFSIPGGANCAINQVLYHVASRGIEYDLLPWMREHGIPLMAYCPLAQAGALKRGLYQNPVLIKIAADHHASISQILLAFVIRGKDTIAIPRSANAVHTMENAGADEVELSSKELALIDSAFPPPIHKEWLDIV